ncbi:UDP-N-acetylmuramoyl-tripeptide--D-alanyl-D-alanine ligase [uncultured Alistipes sp.]|uniref:UDP-N-acetylmuramoyl-tripeptide--D-alanyl-D- alanine ligase n=1 Tax=uncultured Alistipes sp. TaxID=538949 RepID=UPI002606666F|nr:UDP-N-acetylmuramoyl-tripeptide--D-alanyl-D-alanine ligase [uncultured Alistipes sp.]
MELYELFKKHPRISTDSRKIVPDSLFFALHGERFDGNRYAAAALEAGAAVAVVDDPRLAEQAAAATRDRYVTVPDTLAALQELAARHRRALGITVLAITGSNGKTTTKELVGRTLSCRYRTAMTQGNLNNHIGVPLTLLAMDDTVEFGIVEMGASHCGEIARLCEIARPDFGLITNIGKAHLEGFGGEEGVMRGKGELLDALRDSGGEAFYLSESDALRRMVEARPGLRTIPYSTASIETSGTGEFLEAVWQGLPVRTRLVGSYNLANVAAAIAVGTRFGIEADRIVEAVESYVPDNNRSQKKETVFNTLILDAYNANPSSMRAALENFFREPTTRKRAVILGDMRELGDYAEAEHRAVVEMIRTAGIDEAYLVGPHFSAAGAGRFAVFPDVDALCAHLTRHPVRDRTVLVKGSRGIRLEKAEAEL